MEIALKLCELSHEKDFIQDKAILFLEKKYLKAVFVYQSSVNDEVEGWKEKYTNWEIVVLKKFIVSVDKFFNEKQERWFLQIEADGRGQIIEVVFELESECISVYKKIIKWLLG